MAPADLLLGTALKRERWLATGASLIVIDTLVYEWIHRTGILHELGAEHAYGPSCYRPGGCAEIIDQVAGRIEPAGSIPRSRLLPAARPEGDLAFLRSAWSDIRNGNRIDGDQPCTSPTCRLSCDCHRVALRPRPFQASLVHEV